MTINGEFSTYSVYFCLDPTEIVVNLDPSLGPVNSNGEASQVLFVFIFSFTSFQYTPDVNPTGFIDSKHF